MSSLCQSRHLTFLETRQTKVVEMLTNQIQKTLELNRILVEKDKRIVELEEKVQDLEMKVNEIVGRIHMHLGPNDKIVLCACPYYPKKN